MCTESHSAPAGLSPWELPSASPPSVSREPGLARGARGCGVALGAAVAHAGNGGGCSKGINAELLSH